MDLSRFYSGLARGLATIEVTGPNRSWLSSGYESKKSFVYLLNEERLFVATSDIVAQH